MKKLTYKTFSFVIVLTIATLSLNSCTSDRNNKKGSDHGSEEDTTTVKFAYRLTQVRNGIANFASLYRTGYAGNDDTIIWVRGDKKLLRFLLKESKNRRDVGIVFHYGMKPSNKLCYIMSRGTRDLSTKAISHSPFSRLDGSEFYVLLGSGTNGGYDSISRTAFEDLTEHYDANMQRKKSDGTFANIALDLNHPRMVFHDGVEIEKFFTEYSLGDPLYLYIKHGASRTDALSEIYHVPIFMFGNDVDTYPLDDIDYTAYGPMHEYKNKAFDAGHVCPPHCN